MIQTPRALGLGVFLLVAFALHWFYTSVPEGTTFGICPGKDQDLEAAEEYACPASCLKKYPEPETYLEIQKLCGSFPNLKEATEQNGEETGGEQFEEEEMEETLLNTEHEISDVEATGGPSNYSLGTLDGNLRDVMNETLGVSNSKNTHLDYHANLCGLSSRRYFS